MTQQRTEDYRDVLEHVAKERGLSGAEELAARAAEADPDYTVRDILEASYGGFGRVLDDVIDPPLTEEETARIVQALAGARRKAAASGVCMVPGCKCPAGAGRGLRVCEGHDRLFDAQADVEDWELTLKILGPWVQAAEPIGHDPLTRVMEEALKKAEGELRRARREWKEAEAAL